MRGTEPISRNRRRRGAVMVWTTVSMTVLLGFAALSVDLGYLYVVRGQLQVAADAAALAGASAYFSNAGTKQDQSEIRRLAVDRAEEYSLRNNTSNKATVLNVADVLVGRHDFTNPLKGLSSSGRWNAVNVTARRTARSANGPVSLFFANIFGISQTEMTATARAALDDRFAGYRLREDGIMIPFTIFRERYNSMLATGADDYSHDANTVYKLPDDIREIKLYPWKGNGKNSDGSDAAGNFGTLNIGVGNQGTSTLKEQILDGLTAAQMQDGFGASELLFCDSVGTANTYPIGGNPGMSTGIDGAITARIGDVVGFFIHQSVSGNGANAKYAICGIRFGRIMDCILRGNPNQRAVVIQPCEYTSGAIIVDTTAPHTDGYVGRLVLVR